MRGPAILQRTVFTKIFNFQKSDLPADLQISMKTDVDLQMSVLSYLGSIQLNTIVSALQDRNWNIAIYPKNTQQIMNGNAVTT